MGWGKLKVDMGMALEPAIVFGFVGIEIVENDSMPSRNSLDSAGLQTLRVIQKTLQCLIGYLPDLRIDEGRQSGRPIFRIPSIHIRFLQIHRAAICTRW
jgi:hypothetical protein